MWFVCYTHINADTCNLEARKKGLKAPYLVGNNSLSLIYLLDFTKQTKNQKMKRKVFFIFSSFFIMCILSDLIQRRLRLVCLHLKKKGWPFFCTSLLISAGAVCVWNKSEKEQLNQLNSMEKNEKQSSR